MISSRSFLSGLQISGGELIDRLVQEGPGSECGFRDRDVEDVPRCEFWMFAPIGVEGVAHRELSQYLG